MEIKPALEKLFSLHQFGIKLGLDNIHDLLNEINNPHKKLKCFHVAGSNGKGSTASFLASILTEHGYKIGLYTSPHFVRFNERIKINGEEICDEVIIDFVSTLEKYIDKHKPTFFELTTALAFKYFEEQNVDFSVIETGLGGRLDATNVVDPMASIITTISLEHTSQLGNTVEKIAFEKAGIIKKGKPLFVGFISDSAMQVIQKKALETESFIHCLKDCSINSSDSIVVDTSNGNFKIYETPLKGSHQLKNAALAVKAFSETIPNRNNLKISKGLFNVLRNTKIEGRYEIHSKNPLVIFDSAHNLEGIEVFKNEFDKEYLKYKKRTLIFGAMRDKNIKHMLTELNPYFHNIYITSISDDRAAKYDEILKIIDESEIKIENLENPDVYIRDYCKNEKNSCLVVLGSMYLIGEIKSKIL